MGSEIVHCLNALGVVMKEQQPAMEMHTCKTTDIVTSQ